MAGTGNRRGVIRTALILLAVVLMIYAGFLYRGMGGSA
jgi:hypothetical protein